MLFSESNTRFLCEVRPDNVEAFEAALAEIDHALVGEVLDVPMLQIVGIPTPCSSGNPGNPAELAAATVIETDLATLKEAWQAPLRW